MIDAEKLTKQAIERYGENLAVACSFGKDSMVVLDMARKINPNVKVVFNNTGVEFPETIQFKNEMVKKWKLNLIETQPYCLCDIAKMIKNFVVRDITLNLGGYGNTTLSHIGRKKMYGVT
jgi:tRNA(Ile)-lysidine synthase TilS/MesJ